MVKTEQTASSHPTNRVRGAFNRLPSNEPVTALKDNTQLANELATALWQRLPFSRLADEVGHRSIEQIVSVATTSHLKVVAWHNELRSFFEAICKTSIELRGDQSAIDQCRDQLISGILDRESKTELIANPPKSFIDYRFADLLPEVAFSTAEKELEQQCLQLVTALFEFLDRLQKQQLVGAIDQTTSTCRFTFFRRVAIVELPSVRTENRHRGASVDVYRIKSTNVQHRHAMHIHHVHDSQIRAIDLAEHPLPEKYRHFVQSCPEWIRPQLQIVEGDLFREQQIEWDTLNETLDEENLVESREFRWSPDPAIVLGNYVLAGWGEQAISEEHARIQHEQEVIERKASLTSAKRYRFAAYAVAITSVLLMALSTFATPFMVSIAILFGAASIYFASLSSVGVREKGPPSSIRTIKNSLMTGAAVFALQSLVYGFLHWSLPGLLLGGLFSVAAWTIHAFGTKEASQDPSHVN